MAQAKEPATARFDPAILEAVDEFTKDTEMNQSSGIETLCEDALAQRGFLHTPEHIRNGNVRVIRPLLYYVGGVASFVSLFSMLLILASFEGIISTSITSHLVSLTALGVVISTSTMALLFTGIPERMDHALAQKVSGMVWLSHHLQHHEEHTE